LKTIAKIKKAVEKEIDYVTSLYPFDISDYFDHEILYAKSVLSYFYISPYELIRMKKKDENKIFGLATGVELLGIGLSLHRFDPGKEKDSDYVLELLIGDIIYARAINYLLQHGDFDLFKLILDSLKVSHNNRLIIHSQIDDLGQEKDITPGIKGIIENKDLLIKASELLKKSYVISRDVFNSFYPENRLLKAIETDIKGLSDLIAKRQSLREIKIYLAGKGFLDRNSKDLGPFIEKKDSAISSEIKRLEKDLEKIKQAS
jgi:hypothetical protein